MLLSSDAVTVTGVCTNKDEMCAVKLQSSCHNTVKAIERTRINMRSIHHALIMTQLLNHRTSQAQSTVTQQVHFIQSFSSVDGDSESCSVWEIVNRL